MVLVATLFFLGVFFGFLFRSVWGGVPQGQEVLLVSDEPLSRMRLLSVCWSHFRWMLLCVLLSLSALGLFGLPVLILLRGLIFGFSFSALYGSVPLVTLFLSFLFTALFACGPMLVISSLGLIHCKEEAGGRGGGRWQGRPVVVYALVLLLGAALCSVLCAFAELWLLPGILSGFHLS